MRTHTFSLFISLVVGLASLGEVARGEEEPAELAQARTSFQKDVDFATRPIRDRYLSRLDSMKRSFGSRGDARAALAVQEESDRVKEIGAGLERYAGVWSVKYGNGTVRIYSISPEGMLNVAEENGVRITPRIAKITLRGTDFMVESAEGTIERLTLAGGKLIVEHFNPKTSYPNSAPALRATGTRVTAKP